MAVFNPYLNFNGNTEEAFNFYKSVFGGEFLVVMRFKDTPEAGNVPEADQNKLMHIALPIGNGNTLMGTDAIESGMGLVTPGNNFSISIDVESVEEGSKLFNNLSEGGVQVVPFSQAFWGAYFGMINDKFGIQWMVSYDPKNNK